MKLITYYKYDENMNHTNQLSHTKVFRSLKDGKHIEEAKKTNTYMKDIEEIPNQKELKKETKTVIKKIKEKFNKCIQCEETETIARIGIYTDEDEIETISLDFEINEEYENIIDYETKLNKYYIIAEIMTELKNKEYLKIEYLGEYHI